MSGDWVKMWEYVDSIKEQRQDLYDALVGLMPEGWNTSDMDHMTGIKAAREAIEKYGVAMQDLPSRES